MYAAIAQVLREAIAHDSTSGDERGPACFALGRKVIRVENGFAQFWPSLMAGVTYVKPDLAKIPVRSRAFRGVAAISDDSTALLRFTKNLPFHKKSVPKLTTC